VVQCGGRKAEGRVRCEGEEERRREERKNAEEGCGRCVAREAGGRHGRRWQVCVWERRRGVVCSGVCSVCVCAMRCSGRWRRCAGSGECRQEKVVR